MPWTCFDGRSPEKNKGLICGPWHPCWLFQFFQVAHSIPGEKWPLCSWARTLLHIAFGGEGGGWLGLHKIFYFHHLFESRAFCDVPKLVSYFLCCGILPPFKVVSLSPLLPMSSADLPTLHPGPQVFQALTTEPHLVFHICTYKLAKSSQLPSIHFAV
jgi:hypothetical protein